VFKPSRRAFGVAAAFTISAVILAPAASAALLGSGGDRGSALPVPALSGSGLPGLGSADGAGGALLDGVVGLLSSL
jgi:hypothetical protein